MLREMMLYHVSQFTEPRERVRQARVFLDFLNEAVGSSDTNYGHVVREQVAFLKDRSDTYLCHEHLDVANNPVYVHQFAAHAAARGLQFLSEAHLQSDPAQLAPRLVQFLTQKPDLCRQEQYLDFLSNRPFRATLLCHAKVNLQRPPAPERVLTMYVSGLARPEAALPDVSAPAVERFHTEDGIRSTGTPLLKAALVTLFETLPRALPFETLWARVSARLAKQPDLLENGRANLAACVLKAYLANLLDLHGREPALVAVVSARPVASPLARLLAARDPQVPNLWHRYVKLSPAHRQVLRCLDGSRDADALADILTDLAQSGQVTVQEDGQPVRERDKVRRLLRASMDGILQELANNALLVR